MSVDRFQLAPAQDFPLLEDGGVGILLSRTHYIDSVLSPRLVHPIRYEGSSVLVNVEGDPVQYWYPQRVVKVTQPPLGVTHTPTMRHGFWYATTDDFLSALVLFDPGTAFPEWVLVADLVEDP